MDLNGFIFLSVTFLARISFNNACSMDGVTNWLLPVTLSIKDIDRGVFFQRSTSNIAEIERVTYSEGLNAGPYITMTLSESAEFTIATNDRYPNYEELETANSMGITVVFRCSGGLSSALVFVINIDDTNNNAPQFRPNDAYHFKIAPPVPPGFLITDCINDIIARDIDLTTERIEFDIEENQYFEITYDGSSTPKEFKAILRTKTFIRRLPEPITLWISATDVDRTNDPPLTTNGTIRIEADTEFEFPDDLIFSESFYLATYSEDNQVSLQEGIFLYQGYDENVVFSLEGDYEDHFNLIRNGNSIDLNVSYQLPVEIWAQSQIYLIIRASRENTSGATATIIVNLQARTLAFEAVTYSGYLVNNNVELDAIELRLGYDEDVTFTLIGDYSEYFSPSNIGNLVTLTISNEFPEDIISDNSILIFNLLATVNNKNTATTTIILEILKDDEITPVFSQNVYYGTYNVETQLSIGNISLIQGFNENVIFRLSGDHAQYFDIAKVENDISLFVRTVIPRELIYGEKVLIFNIMAEKPFTVGANAAVSINFPRELTDPIVMRFSKRTYIGRLENNTLTIEIIVLSEGFEPQTEFLLFGDYARYFAINQDTNSVTLNLIEDLPTEVIENNAFLTLEIEASHPNMIRGYSTIVLEIIKEKQINAEFKQPYYYGEYSIAHGLSFTQIIQLEEMSNEDINLKLEGDNSNWFSLTPEANGASLATVAPLPSEFLANNRQLIFIVSAETYDNITIARSTIIIALTDELNNMPMLTFEKTNYIGTTDNIALDLEPISIVDDFSVDVEFTLHGELASYFTKTSNGGTVSVTLPNPIPEESLPTNGIITLELQVNSSQALSNNAIIIIQVLSNDDLENNILQFSDAYYIGFYDEIEGLEFDNNIMLTNGYDDSVQFSLHGGDSIWFKVTYLNEGVTISINDSLVPPDFAGSSQLIFEINANTANSPSTAKATIIIILTEKPITHIEFRERYYTGSIDNAIVDLEPISLIGGSTIEVTFLLTGEFSDYFTQTVDGGVVHISLDSVIPEDILNEIHVIVLELKASATEVTPSYTTIILEIIKENELPSEVLKFNQTYYTGVYREPEGLVFDSIIALESGYDEKVEFTLDGEDSTWFKLENAENGLRLAVSEPIPVAILSKNWQLTFIITANKPESISASATIVISLPDDNSNVFFDELYYRGVWKSEDMSHERIFVSGYNGTTIEITGQYGDSFTAQINEGNVIVELRDTSVLPIDTTHVVLELRVPGASCVLILDVIDPGNDISENTNVFFDELYYTGIWRSEDMSHERIFVSGYNGTTIEINGQYGDSFTAQINDGNVIVELRDTSILPIDTTHVVLELRVPGASCVLILDVIDPDISENSNVFFDELYYTGIWRSEDMSHERIFVSGYNGTTIEINGQYGDSFTAQINEGNVMVELRDTSVLPIDTTHVVLELRVPGASCVLILDVIDPGNDISENTNVFFDELYYTGIWRSEDMSHERIFVSGYNGTTIEINGQYGDSFTAQINEGNVMVELRDTSVLPIDTTHVVLELRVPGASCVLILDVIDPDISENTNVFFDELYYTGIWRSEDMSHERIFVSGYNGTTIEINGQYGDSFTAQINEGNVIVELRDTSVLPIDTTHVVLELRVPGASCVLILDVIDPDISENTNVSFDELYYTGIWRSEDMSHERIFVSGYNGTSIEINGQYGDSFTAQINEGNVMVELRDTSVLPIDTTHVVLELRVPGASCVLILDVIDPDISENTNVFFDELYYTGIWRSEDMSHERIFVSGYNGTTIEINGQYGDSFTAQINEGNVIVDLRDTSVLPIDTTHVVLELRVPGASCVLILDVIDPDISDNTNVFFDELYYTGIWRNEDMSHERIFVTGYNGTTIQITGQYGDSFTAQINEGNVIVELRETSILPTDTYHVVLELRIPGAGSVLILNVEDPDISVNTSIFFDELYYTGIWRSEDISHERIFVYGYIGTTIEIAGQYSDSFAVQINEGNVVVELRDTSVLPTDTSHVVLELRVPGAGSVLILNVIDPENPDFPTVRFSSEFYVMQVDKSQTGLIGQVSATASNGENIVYSLLIEQDELKGLLSVNNDGQVHLNAPVTNGIYNCLVLATTELTLAENRAVVLLVVDGADFCSNERALSPLIILDKDEESPYEDLVVLNKTIHENCHYSMINHWPVDQGWLYVDENGLHTSSIDREHESIAFMALSQIQVELILHCDTRTSNTTRIKRSLNPYVTDTTNLGPYDYGTSKWVLTDSISYNSRRSFVNLIVNDINDNDPIFTLKEHEPIAVGYPLPELVDAVSPQALVELKATDADIGENAALLYWTAEPMLAVSPTTGFVHVRNNGQLENRARFTIHATDRNGAGRTGSIDIVIRLLNINSIAVVTIRGAFLEDENTVLANLSNSLGYEVKSLRSVIVPENSNETENARRKKRETDDGALLQLYIYGLIDREPVEVARLTNDINNNVIIGNVATTVSLREHLENREIRVTERDTALLAATIALSVLLFILIVAFVGWQYLKWRKKRNYDRFSDVNSFTSEGQIPQPPKTDDVDRPRLNLEELRRSERRLQDILDTPTNTTNISEPKPQKEIPTETIVNLSPEQRMPLVIQSIDKLKDAKEATDDEDEFGETQSPRRKSVVTFNENVEKIIHVDDSSQSEGEYEVSSF